MITSEEIKEKIKLFMDEIFNSDTIDKENNLLENNLLTLLSLINHMNTKTGKAEIDDLFNEIFGEDLLKRVVKHYKHNTYSLMPISTIISCIRCKGESQVLGFYMNIEDNSCDIMAAGFCAKCFKEEYPDYTLEKQCSTCPRNFKCETQKILFSEKEINDFKNRFIPDVRDLELI